MERTKELEGREMGDKAGRRPIPARNLAITKRVARWMADRGVTPNMISQVGLAVGVGSGIALGLTQVFPAAARPLWAAAAVMVLIRGISNMLDGMVAVEQHRGTATGLFWNELPDRVSDVALLAGAGYSLGGSPVAGWLAACLALFVTYVRAIGVIAGAPADFRGPFAKQQRMFSVAILAAVLAVAPEAWRFSWGPGGAWGPMAVLLWVMVPGIVWTAIRRLRRAVEAVDQAAHQ
jgi:phosphatidylglycerophosphate synthase